MNLRKIKKINKIESFYNRKHNNRKIRHIVKQQHNAKDKGIQNVFEHLYLQRQLKYSKPQLWKNTKTFIERK